jgi:hypothetical protein
LIDGTKTVCSAAVKVVCQFAGLLPLINVLTTSNDAHLESGPSVQDFAMSSGSIRLDTFPEEPLLSLISEALGLLGHDPFTQIDTVLQHQTQSGLTLYLPRGIQFAAQLGVEVEPVDRLSDGSVELLSCGKARYFDTTQSAIQIERSNLLNSGAVLVHEVVYQEDHFLPVNECQLLVEPLCIEPAKMFAKRSELQQFLKDGCQTLPRYLDPSNDLYAPELALAVDLHRELIEGGLHSHLNVQDRVYQWLTINRPDSSPPSAALVKRLAAIINPKKKKGNPLNRS